MEDKKVDGIKKIDKKDLLKSREAVLSAIKKAEEAQNKPAATKAEPARHKRAKGVDAIMHRTEAIEPPDFKLMAEKPESRLDIVPDLPLAGIGGSGRTAAIAEKTESAEKPQAAPVLPAADKQKEKAELLKEQARARAEAKKRIERARREAEESKLAAERQKQEEEKRRQEEKDRQERLKRDQERKDQERLESRKRRAQKRQKRVEQAGNMARHIRRNFKAGLIGLVRWVFNVIIFAAVVALLFYTVFALLLLKFNLDNPTARKLEIYARVPAVITKQGIVDYYTYKDTAAGLKTEYANQNNYLTQLQNHIARMILTEQLEDKYDIHGANSADLTGKLNRAVVADNEINPVGINRTAKIKDMIDKGGNFVEIATKYGDQLDKADFSTLDEAKARFGETIGDLAIGGISGIITLDDGYYILRRYENAGAYSYSYVFVKAITLDDYLGQQAGQLKMWSLADLK